MPSKSRRSSTGLPALRIVARSTIGWKKSGGALKLVAGAIARSVHRPDDFVARYGGEEFIVLLPYCSSSDAIGIADGIRAAVQSLEIRHDIHASGRLTMSAGAASVAPSELAAPDQMIAAADRALYVAKHGGRNRVAGATTLVA